MVAGVALVTQKLQMLEILQLQQTIFATFTSILFVKLRGQNEQNCKQLIIAGDPIPILSNMEMQWVTFWKNIL